MSKTRAPRHHPQFVLAHDDAHQGILRLRASLKMLTRLSDRDTRPRASIEDVAAAEDLAARLEAVLATWDTLHSEAPAA